MSAMAVSMRRAPGCVAVPRQHQVDVERASADTSCCCKVASSARRSAFRKRDRCRSHDRADAGEPSESVTRTSESLTKSQRHGRDPTETARDAAV